MKRCVERLKLPVCSNFQKKSDYHIINEREWLVLSLALMFLCWFFLAVMRLWIFLGVVF
jgi:hypothetical protein